MQKIQFSTIATQHGKITIAATERGLCSLLPNSGRAELQAHFPHALLEKNDAALTNLAAQVQAAIISGDDKNIVYDLHGTEFQKSIWQALRSIPLGSTITYGELASKINKPKAIRAAASACGANPIAILIPCHRVIGKNGKLTGYHWGLEMKKNLLQHEGVSTGNALNTGNAGFQSAQKKDAGRMLAFPEVRS